MSLSSWVIFRYCLILGSIGIAQCHRRLPTHDAIFTDRVTFHSFNSNGWVHSSSFKSSNSVFPDIASLGCRGGADWDVTPEENDDDDRIANETPELETEAVDEENDIDEESDEEPNPVAATTKPPVKLVIKTGLNNQLIDQSLELMASRTRDVASLKLSCFRQMRGRPPVELQTIRLGMAALDDHMTIDDILGDDEDDDDDEDEEDADEPTLVLTLDIAPPVDPKFGTELGELVKSKTTGELIEAYAANQACLMGISKLIAGSSSSNIDQVVEGETEEEVDIAEESPSKSNPVLESETLWMRKQASIVKEQLLSTMSEDALKMLDKTDEEEESSDALLVSSIRKSRRGGARMNMKRVLQRNLNIVSMFVNTLRIIFLILPTFSYSGLGYNYTELPTVPFLWILWC